MAYVGERRSARDYHYISRIEEPKSLHKFRRRDRDFFLCFSKNSAMAVLIYKQG
jgi:hypothetical protein